MRNWRNVPVPDLMERLPRDKRGFPIPFIVGRDNAGEPLFTINDEAMTRRCIAEMLCGICGNPLEIGDLWWIGGPLSGFHPQGAFVDGPMHCDCSTYALQVCPHLAAPKYMKRVDALPASKNGVPFNVAYDHTVMPDRPVVFIQGQSTSYSVSYPLRHDRHLYPCSGVTEDGRPKRWQHYEVWRIGELLDEAEGIELIRQAFEDMPKQTTQKPKLMGFDKPEIIT